MGEIALAGEDATGLVLLQRRHDALALLGRRVAAGGAGVDADRCPAEVHAQFDINSPLLLAASPPDHAGPAVQAVH
jgi:hypothetical protein